MKLYTFTEQSLKLLLEQYAINILNDIKDADKDNRPVNKHDSLYPAFPEPIELPDESDAIYIASEESQQDWNRLEYKQIYYDGVLFGLNHIIQIIKNGLK